MATDIERLMVRLEANATKFEREMDRARNVGSRATADIDRNFANLNPALAAQMARMGSIASSGASAVNTALAGIGAGGAASIAGIVAFSDQYARLINQLKGAEIGRPDQAIGDIARAAISGNAPLAESVALFRELSVASKQTGASYAENIATVEALAKAMSSEGKTAEEVGEALRDLSFELKYGEGKASDYLETLQESPRLFEAVAKAIGKSKQELRDQIDEEEIGAGRIQQAILSARPIIDQNFKDALPEASKALANLGTAVQLFAGQTSSSIAQSKELASVIQLVSENFGMLATGAIAVGEAIAIVLIGRAIMPLIASLGAAGVAAIVNFSAAVSAMGFAAASSAVGMGALSGAMSLLLNPVTLAIVAIGGLATVLYQMQAAQDPAKLAADNHAKALKELDQAIRLVSTSAPQTAEAVRKLGVEQLKQADAAITNAKANLSAAQAMLAAAQAQRGYQSMAGAGEFGILGEAMNAGVENTADARLLEANKSLDARVKEREAIGDRLKKFETDLSGGVFTSKIDPNAGVDKSKDGKSSGNSGDKKDAFDREIEQFNKKIALLKVEKDTLGLLTSEREKAKAVVELTQAAERAGIELSEEQKQKIQELASSYGGLQQALETARQAQQQFVELQQFIGSNLSSFFSDIVSGGKNASDALMNMTKRLSEAALQALILGQGPLAGIFGTASSSKGGVGGLIGGIFSAFGSAAGAPGGLPFGGPRANGGPVSPGNAYLVGEKRPELFVPKVPGRIVPRVPNMGGGNGISITQNMSFNGQQDPAMLAQFGARIKADTLAAVQAQRASRPDYLSRGM